MEFFMKLRYVCWGPWTVLLFLCTGVYMTYCSAGVQFWCLRALIKQLRKPKQVQKIGISPLQALFTSLGGTLGVGNLAGVATAITLGGAGAVFYMLLAAFFGMATKFAEIVCAVRFRQRSHGSPLGGPMVYLSKGAYHPHLAVVFCIFCLLASLTTGTLTQSAAIVQAVHAIAPLSPLSIGLMTAALAYPILTGGSPWIAKISAILVPLMTGLYLLGGISVLLLHHRRIVPALLLIASNALHPQSATGGILGLLTSHAVTNGFSKGVFSNEAGLGSAPIAHGCADSYNPCTQGVLGAVEVFIDTFLVCLLTALVILVTDAPSSGATGLALTTYAFGTVFGPYAMFFIGIVICFLAFSTILGWSFYGIACLRYLTNSPLAQTVYCVLITLCIALASYVPLQSAMIIADIATALMAFPNLIGLWTLAPVLRHEIKTYHLPAQ